MISSNQTKSLLEVMEKNEDPSAFADALGLLEKLITNIINNPNDDKFKHIKMTVKTLATRLFNIRQMTELLTSLGFIQLDQEFYLPDEEYVSLLQNFNTIKWQHILSQGRVEGPQQYQKAQEIVRQQQEAQRQYEKEQKEKEKIQQQIKYDRQERSLVKEKDSKANDLQFGAKVKTCEQLGINKNTGKRG
ncbi:unnamed protein product [Paramecium pentaurelia]|uniref:PUB domain-containing protein n=1 Tax=Paramecium pentaurelia TaxID=43138 RepID=A0A8S1VR42_9CILI|nr:unnamed protein product [Paramecium pentaurelia]